MVTPSATTLKDKALQLLALRDYSRAELQAKLLRWLRTQTVKQAAKQATQRQAARTYTPRHANTLGDSLMWMPTTRATTCPKTPMT